MRQRGTPWDGRSRWEPLLRSVRGASKRRLKIKGRNGLPRHDRACEEGLFLSLLSLSLSLSFFAVSFLLSDDNAYDRPFFRSVSA